MARSPLATVGISPFIGKGGLAIYDLVAVRSPLDSCISAIEIVRPLVTASTAQTAGPSASDGAYIDANVVHTPTDGLGAVAEVTPGSEGLGKGLRRGAANDIAYAVDASQDRHLAIWHVSVLVAEVGPRSETIVVVGSEGTPSNGPCSCRLIGFDPQFVAVVSSQIVAWWPRLAIHGVVVGTGGRSSNRRPGAPPH